MKKIGTLIIILLLFPSFIALADSYKKMWHEIDELADKDMPKTRIEKLDRIIDKADEEHSYGNLLKAIQCRLQCRYTISPDSFNTDITALNRDVELMDKSSLKYCLFNSLLGTVYRDHARENVSDQSERVSFLKKADVSFARSLSNPELLSNTETKSFYPFFSKDNDDDLLKTLSYNAGIYDVARNYYINSGNRSGAVLMSLELLKKETKRDAKYVASLDSLINLYGDLNECCEVAIEKYNFISGKAQYTSEMKIKLVRESLSRWGKWKRAALLKNAEYILTQPSFEVSLSKTQLTEGDSAILSLNKVRNVNTITTTIWKTDFNTEDIRSFIIHGSWDYKFYTEAIKKLKKKNAISFKHTFDTTDYELSKHSEKIGNLKKGIYIVETKCSNKSINPIFNIIYVSNLYVLTESLPNDKMRIAVVDANTGLPIKGAKVSVFYKDYQNLKSESKTLTCNDNGEILYEYEGRPRYVYAYTDEDKYMPLSNTGSTFNFYERNKDSKHAVILTDRAVYRPGQTVKVAIINYTNIKGRDLKALADEEIEVTLYDVNRKALGTKNLKSDVYGTASTEFILPKSTLNGSFLIKAGDYNYSSIRVEEYKRPTFRVSFSEVKEKYSFGDTVEVKGVAETYSGVPVQNAKVRYRIKRVWSPWYRYFGNNSNDVICKDSTITSNDGTFSINVPLTAIEDKEDGFYRFVTEVDITDLGGETRYSEKVIPLSKRDIWFDCDIPDKAERGKIKTIRFSVTNAAGNEIDADVKFKIDDGAELSARSNKDIPTDSWIGTLASGKHTITASVNEETVKKEFIIFSLNDKVPAIHTDDWFYTTSDTFPQNGGNVYMQIGSSLKDVHVFYTIISGNNIIKMDTISLNNEIKTFPFTYDEKYGDGIFVDCAWVKNNKLYSHRTSIKKPLPDKYLNMRWETFRDRLSPGQKEKWTLHVSRKDNSNADASLVATLYDMSLDNIVSHSWETINGINRFIPYTGWYGNLNAKTYDNATAELKLYNPQDIIMFEKIPSIFTGRYPNLYDNMVLSGTRSKSLKGLSRNYIYKEAADVNVSTPQFSENKETTINNDRSSDVPQLRENMSETAFFYPSLTTDGNGNVNISFILPESITAWKFMAFAHDKEMRNNVFTDRITAQKEVMIQPNVPRFVRNGDIITIPAKIFNLSGKEISGKAHMQICDAETGNVLSEKVVEYDIKSDSTKTILFKYDADVKAEIVICKIFAKGKKHSDGEQHYLPIIPNKEMITDTRIITIDKAGSYKYDAGELFTAKAKNKKLTIEYADNPAWFVIQALPNISDGNGKDIVSTVTRIYANTLAQHIAKSSPDIKNIINLWSKEIDKDNSITSNLQKDEELKQILLEETPWVRDAENETERKHRLSELFDENLFNDRIANDIEKLKSEQLSDGSWGWYPGMSGNRYITTAVTELLVRLNSMTGENENLTAIIDEALKYLSVETDKELKSGKKDSRKRLTSTSLKYLYIKALRNDKFKDSDKQLISLLEGYKYSELTIYEKSMAAVILNNTGRKEKAKDLIRSIKEYSVCTSEMGRYFDTEHAGYSWFDYKIPSEVMAIEALREVTPEDRITISEMQKWLLQEKRTTSWSTPINSANAIYAFTKGGENIYINKEKTDIKLNGKEIKGAKAGTGYIKYSEEGNKFTLSVNKKSNGISWMSLYSTYTTDVKDAGISSSGIKIRREYVSKDINNVNTGDRIKVRIIIDADRDYDFVQITDKRAACMEPVNNISGYNGEYYSTLKDNSTNYFFDRMSKGRHIIETEYYIDRKGTYNTGICSVQCAYAPEYNARTETKTIIVK